MYITYEFNNWWKYHFATFTWKISQHFEGFVVSIIIGQLLHFFRNACIKSGSLRFSHFSGCWLILSVYILMSFDFAFGRLFGVWLFCYYLYRISVSQMTMDLFILSSTQSRPSTLLFTYILFCDVDHC